MKTSDAVLLITNAMNYGDSLYHTPLIRRLRKDFKAVHLWCKNIEPFLNNSSIEKLFRVHESKTAWPRPFYFNNIIRVNFEGPLKHHSCHILDYVTLLALGIQLPNDEKEIEFNPGNDAFETAHRILHENNINPYEYVVIAPVGGWPSRTMPKLFYEQLVDMLISRGRKVIAVGRTINPAYIGADRPELLLKEAKFVLEGPFLKKCINLLNLTSLHETAALLELAEYAVIGETGIMPLTGGTRCPFVYIPQLIPPELRLPWRNGKLGYAVEVVRRNTPYVSQDYWRGAFRLDLVPGWVPILDDVSDACSRLEDWINTEGKIWRKANK